MNLLSTTDLIIWIILTVLLPPLGVFLLRKPRGGCGADLIINIILTCLGYFPGHIHAFYLGYKQRKAEKLSPLGTVIDTPVTAKY